MRPARHRVVSLALLGVLAGSGVALGTVTATSGCASAGRVSDRSDGWSRINPPAASSGDATVAAYAVVPRAPATLVISSDQTLQRSVDGGCSWRLVYDAGVRDKVSSQSALSGLTPRRITHVAVSPSDPRLLYAIVLEKTVEFTVSDAQSYVLTSSDDGKSWQNGNGGVPIAGEVLRMRVAANSATALLAVRQPARSLDVGLYATGDGGTTWEQRNPRVGGTPIYDFAINPHAPQQLWAWNADGLLRSTDGGATFSAVAGVRGPVSATHVVSDPRRPDRAVVTAYRANANERLTSTDGGSRWRPSFAPSTVDSVASGITGSTALALSSAGHVYVDPGWSVPIDASPAGVTSLRDVALDRRAPTPMLYANGGHALYRRRFDVPRPPPVRLPPVATIPRTKPVPQPRARITPTGNVVRLAPDETASVDYTLELPAVPTPLDVFFLVDTTSSMAPTIAGLREGIGQIARDLAAVRIDAQFGLGDFKDYPIAPYGEPGDYPYRLRLPISPAGEPLRRAIESLRVGGGGDSPESQLAAIQQVATGAGQSLTPAIRGIADLIPPGQDARFRPTAMKVVILATDVQFHSEPTYPGPSFETTLRDLNQRGVRAVGLAVSEERGTIGPVADLSRLATGTGATAPSSGVDCDADGKRDVTPDGPLVCPLRGSGSRLELADAIVALLRGVRDQADVELSVTGDPRVVYPPTPSVLPQRNLKIHHRAPFRVLYSCPAVVAGRTFPTQVTATLRGEVVAVADTRVVCAPEPVAGSGVHRAAAQPPSSARQHVAAPPVPPIPPAHQIPQANLAQGHAPAPQAHLQAAGAVAPEVVPAPQPARIGEREELAFSDRRDDTATAAALGLAACTMLAVAGWLARERVRVVPARAPTRTAGDH